MKNKIIALLIALTMLGQISVTASAISTSGETGESSAILNQEQTSFRVTVPTSLPIAVDSDGVVTTATDVEIHNNSYGPIVISDIQVDVANGWSLVDFDKDMSKSAVGLKEFGLSIQNDKVQPDGSIALTPSSWESVSGGGIKSFNYDAIVSPQKTALSDINIANVVFVLGWAENSKYTLATDDDFIKIGDDFQYIGTDEYVEIPHVIQGENVESYKSMFAGTSVKGVKSTNPNVINMGYMFAGSTADTLDLSDLNTAGVLYMYEMFSGSQARNLDLSSFDTSNVVQMGGMFALTKATTLDLSSFDTSNVTDMQSMFYNSEATSIDLSSFDTSNVTDMQSMFYNAKTTTLDLSSFDTSKAYVNSMFDGSQVTTGYARTQTDADKLNLSSGKPAGLTFTVK